MHYDGLTSYLEGEQERVSLLKNANLISPLIIEKIYISQMQRGEKDYSVTKSVESLEIDELGIIGDRHRELSGFRPRLREGYIYPKGVFIRQERHILVGTQAMAERISEKMEIDISAELLGWNIVFSRPDGEKVYLDGLPLGTDFMIYPAEAMDTSDKTSLIVNLRLVTYQMGCGITGLSIAHAYEDKSQTLNFVENSQLYRGAVLAIDGPKGEHTLKVGQKVFIGIPKGYIH